MGSKGKTKKKGIFISKFTFYLYLIIFPVEYIQEEKRRKLTEIQEIPSVDMWLLKFKDKNIKEDDKIHTFWNYPTHFENRTDLPPSLVQFRPEHFFDDNFEEWGK